MNELSILTGVDSSSYFVLDDKRQVVAIRSISHDEHQYWLPEDKRLENTFKDIRLAWHCRYMTIVPTRLYNGEERRTYLDKLCDLPDNYTVLADSIPELGITLVYGLGKTRLAKWRSALVGCRFYHILTPILHRLALRAKQAHQPQMIVYVRDQQLTVIGLDKEKLTFCNTFECHAAKDFLYFTLLAYEQCQWNPHEIPLFLAGEVLEESEIYRLYARYVRHLNFLSNASDQIHWGSRSTQQPAHFFYDLTALQLYN